MLLFPSTLSHTHIRKLLLPTPRLHHLHLLFPAFVLHKQKNKAGKAFIYRARFESVACNPHPKIERE